MLGILDSKTKKIMIDIMLCQRGKQSLGPWHSIREIEKMDT